MVNALCAYVDCIEWATNLAHSQSIRKYTGYNHCNNSHWLNINNLPWYTNSYLMNCVNIQRLPWQKLLWPSWRKSNELFDTVTYPKANCITFKLLVRQSSMLTYNAINQHANWSPNHRQCHASLVYNSAKFCALHVLGHRIVLCFKWAKCHNTVTFYHWLL